MGSFGSPFLCSPTGHRARVFDGSIPDIEWEQQHLVVMIHQGVTDLDKADLDLDWLLERFHQVLVSTSNEDVAAALPWRNQASSGLPPSDRATQAFSIAFQLLNQVEENAAAQQRRRFEDEQGVGAERGLWGQVLQALVEAGKEPQQLREELGQIRVEPVLTAHPTEAKRATVLEHYRELYLLLVKRENPVWTKLEQAAIDEQVETVLERLWRTGDIFLEKPDIQSELTNVLYYLRRVFPLALQSVDSRLERVWSALELGRPSPKFPTLSFATWVGGDRDGHPLVTHEVTKFTLSELYRLGRELVAERLVELARRLSLSARLQEPPDHFLTALEELTHRCGQAGQNAVGRNPKEPWRQWVSLMQVRLEDGSAAYRRSHEVLRDLERLEESLEAVGATRLIKSDLKPVVRTVESFGLHLAKLDVRQNSSFHDRALAQLLAASGFEEPDFGSWSRERKRDFLQGELRSPRPFTHPDASLGEEAQAVLDTFRVLRAHWACFGLEGLGALIVSMTRDVCDLLTVYLFAREVGFLAPSSSGPYCPMPVVPLFETIEDLQNSPVILKDFLQHPFTRARFDRQGPVQQVMIGYVTATKTGAW